MEKGGARLREVVRMANDDAGDRKTTKNRPVDSHQQADKKLLDGRSAVNVRTLAFPS
jgi:hypothetical protein